MAASNKEIDQSLPEDETSGKPRKHSKGTSRGKKTKESREEVFPSKHIKPEPSEILQIPIERARALATLPRGKWPERTLATLYGLLGSLPGTVDAFIKSHEATTSQPVILVSFEGAEVITTAVFTTLFISSLVGRITAQKTSFEYLEELRSGTPHLSWWQRFWRWLSDANKPLPLL